MLIFIVPTKVLGVGGDSATSGADSGSKRMCARDIQSSCVFTVGFLILH